MTAGPQDPQARRDSIATIAARAAANADTGGDRSQLHLNLTGGITLDAAWNEQPDADRSITWAEGAATDPEPVGDDPNGLIDYSWWSNNTTGFAFPDSDGEQRYLHGVLSWPLMRLRDGWVFTPQITLQQGDAGDGIELDQGSSILVRRLTT